MKSNKATYFSIFFLFCFLASFSVNTFQAFNFTSVKAEKIKNEFSAFSKKDHNTDNEIDFLLEENENETQDVFYVPAFVLPFFITYYQFQSVIQKPFSAQPLAENLANPIYISVCNFRI